MTMPDAEQPVEGSPLRLPQLIGRQITGVTPDGKALTLGAFAGSGEITLTWDWSATQVTRLPHGQEGHPPIGLYAYWSKKG